jgi:hypothetical protein
MNMTRVALAAVAGMIVFFSLGFVAEGALFRADFQPYHAVYREKDELQKYMPMGMLGLLAAIFVLAAIYARWCGGAPGWLSGLQFGLLVGVFVACVHPISNLVTMNLGAKLGLEIAASTFVQWTAVGLAFGVVYRTP